MKKLILFILIPFSVYSAVIDVGSKPTTDSGTLGITIITKANPSNGTGTIDQIDVELTNSTGTVDFASFTDEGSDVLSTNGTALGVSTAIGVQTLNAPGDFTAFNISTGEYIGMAPQGSEAPRFDSGGSGSWWKSGDNIPASSVTFTSEASRDYYLYGEGETGGAVSVTVLPDALPITVALLTPNVALESVSIIQGATLQGAVLN